MNKTIKRTDQQLTQSNRIRNSEDPIVRDAMRVARADIRNCFNDQGHLKPLSEIDPDTAAAIASIGTEEIFEGKGTDRRLIGMRQHVKMRDKIEALGILLDLIIYQRIKGATT
jgi:hypothetical protein